MPIIHKISPAFNLLLAGLAVTYVVAEQKQLSQSEITQQVQDSIRKILEGYLLEPNTKDFVLAQKALKLVEEEFPKFKLINNTPRLYKINLCKIERIKDLLAKIIQEYKSRPQLAKSSDPGIFEKALETETLNSFTIFIKDSGFTNIYICIGEDIYKSNNDAHLIGEAALQAAVISKYFDLEEKDKSSTTTKPDKDIADQALATLENILKNHRELDPAVVNQLKFNVIPKAKQRVQQSGTKTFTLVIEVGVGVVVLLMVISACKLTYDLAKDKKYRTEETKVVGRKSNKPPIHTIKNPNDTNPSPHIEATKWLLRSQQKKSATTRKIKK